MFFATFIPSTRKAITIENHESTRVPWDAGIEILDRQLSPGCLAVYRYWPNWVDVRIFEAGEAVPAHIMGRATGTIEDPIDAAQILAAAYDRPELYR